jgi:hypothetical protein
VILKKKILLPLHSAKKPLSKEVLLRRAGSNIKITIVEATRFPHETTRTKALLLRMTTEQAGH